MATLSEKPLLDIQPDFATEPTLDVARSPDMVALSEAPRIVAFPTTRPLHRLYHEFAPQTAAAVWALEQFFNARAGKWEAFYVPSWHGELELAVDLESGQQQAQVVTVGYAANLLRADELADAIGGHVFFYSEAGVLFCTRITAASDGSVVDTLTLGDVAPADFLMGRCVVGFVYHVRFSQDEFLARFMGPGHARVSLTMQEARDYTPEPDAGCIGIHDFFEEYNLGDVTVSSGLVQGCGFSVSSIRPNRIASVAFESFDIYDVADPADPADLTGGLFWDGGAQVAVNYMRTVGEEFFEGYDLGSTGGNPLDEGQYWSGIASLSDFS